MHARIEGGHPLYPYTCSRPFKTTPLTPTTKPSPACLTLNCCTPCICIGLSIYKVGSTGQFVIMILVNRFSCSPSSSSLFVLLLPTSLLSSLSIVVVASSSSSLSSDCCHQ
eukprot:TRINITY_DN13942_c0_g1_i1.p1 TRINITY_DN13942_c0_g1~~TRINITY_DN13942_c0_g1_i1.p1  ORF type:complete len:111 (+),score=3.92 TRINITY_DN13942_c0_g1_i1:122-454(+)